MSGEMTVTTEWVPATTTLGERIVVRSPGKSWRIPTNIHSMTHEFAVRSCFPDMEVVKHHNEAEVIGKRTIYRWIVRPVGIREAATLYALAKAEGVAVVITEETRAQAFAAIRATHEAAEGDSNDDEIEALQEARDILADLVGWKDDE